MDREEWPTLVLQHGGSTEHDHYKYVLNAGLDECYDRDAPDAFWGSSREGINFSPKNGLGGSMMLSPTNNPVPFIFCCIRLDACTLDVRVRNGVLLLRVTVFTFSHVDVCSPAITLKLLKIQILHT